MPKRGFFSIQSVRRLLIFILIFTVGGPVILFVVYRHLTNEPQNMVEIIKSEADMVFKNVEQTAIRNGINEWRLHAQAAYLMESQKKWFSNNRRLSFF